MSEKENNPNTLHKNPPQNMSGFSLLCGLTQRWNIFLSCWIRGSLERFKGNLKKKKKPKQKCNSSLSYTNRVSGGQREKREIFIELCFLPFGGDTELIIDKE